MVAGKEQMNKIKSNLNTLFSIPGICVRDDYQGRGLGKKFMNYLIREAEKMGKKGLRLTVYKDNERAYSLYKKLGFREERIVIHMRLNFEEGDKVRQYQKFYEKITEKPHK